MRAIAPASRECDFPAPRSRLARRLSVAAMFRLDPTSSSQTAQLHAAAAAAAATMASSLPAGRIGLISGPSGSGKSTVLRQLASRLRRDRSHVVTVAPASSLLRERRTPLDLLRGELDADIRLLCQCGLAEAPLWIRPSRLLSEGQRCRLSLALALSIVRDSPSDRAWLIADEFASALDRITAMTLCRSVRSFIHAAPARLVVASAHDDLGQWLAPDASLHLEPAFATHGRFSFSRSGAA